MKKFQIEVTEKQLQLLSYACEKADRQIIGQLDISLKNDCLDAWEREYKKENGIKGVLKTLPPEWHDVRHEIERHIDELRQLCWNCDKFRYYGISYDNTADTLWDMHRVFRHALWNERPGNERSYITVDSENPSEMLRYGSEPYAKIIKVIDDGKKRKSK